MIRTIAFDADDTLWHNETHYRDAETWFSGTLAAYHDGAWIQERLLATETRNLAHFGSGHTSGYLGTVSQDVGASPRDYDALTRDIILHGSPATIIAKIEELHGMTGNASIMLHFPPWYGAEKALASLELFAAEVMPKFKDRPRAQKSA